MNKLLLLASTVAVLASVGCGHTQRLQWHLPQLEIDSGGIGFYIPFPTVKDEEIAYESPLKISPIQETEIIRWTEPIHPIWEGGQPNLPNQWGNYKIISSGTDYIMVDY